MSSLTKAVQRAASRAVIQSGPAWLPATVAAVNTDGTVDITTATGPVTGVRRLRSYKAPTIGDIVSVTRGADGNWLVEGATASLNPAWQPLTLASGWAAHASFYTPAVRHNGDGTASLSGLSQLSGALTAGATVATLPAGTWPARQVRVAVQVAAGYFGVLTILTTGEIQLSDFNPAPPSTGNKWTEFDAVGSYRLV